MKVIRAITAMLLSLTLCEAQDRHTLKRDPDRAYAAQLVRLLAGLQKNPWQGWKAGTVVVVRYLADGGPATKPFAHVQPDLVYRILEADKLFIRTQELKGKSIRQDFLVKDQKGLDAASIQSKDAAAVDVELDGFTLPAFLSVVRMDEWPDGSWTTKEWSLAGHPSILLRHEANGGGWRVTSAKVLKKIGEREFSCVEIKRTLRIYSGGPADVMTTQYLSPDVPGHLVEEIQEFYRIGDRQKSPALFLFVHQKVVEIKPQ